MIRVLHVVGKMHRAGQETITMNIYREIDREELQFDFLVHTREHCGYDDEIRALGGRILPVDKVTPLTVGRYVRSIRDAVRSGGYEIVHLHTAHSAGFLVLLGAKLGGARVRIAHSRNNYAKPALLHKLLRPAINHYATLRCACSELAGRWMFGKRPFRVLHNAIPTDRFAFDPAVRERKRAELGLGGALVLGHLGRFTEQKNHGYLLRVFAETAKREPEFRLLLAGDGELMDEMRALAGELGIGERVLFLGSRDDVPELLMAVDVFVFPSLYEGFGNVVTEAQASGLPCIVSDTLSRETRMTPEIEYLSIREPPSLWAERILALPRERDRSRGIELVSKAGFNARVEAGEYMALYREQLKK